jgi:NAD+ kinase
MGRRRVLLLGNGAKPEVLDAIESLRGWISDRCDLVVVDTSENLHEARDAEGDIAVVFGGDGTMLGAARALHHRDIPLLGVNLGKLGYLTEFTVDELKSKFQQIVDGQIQPERRMTLTCRIEGPGRTSFQSVAINDVSITAGPPFRMVGLSILIDQEHVTQMLGDGLVISTPTGSTAYSLSAGGPIVSPRVHALLLTPICAHSLTHRPIVADADRVIVVEASAVNPGTTAFIDGQISDQIREGDRIEVRRRNRDLMLIPNPDRQTWSILQEKLHWGRQIRGI